MPKINSTTKDDEILKMIARNVKFYRINNNRLDDATDELGRITQEKLAELSGTSASMISNIEAPSMVQNISIPFLCKIADALNVPLYAFFLEKPYKNPSSDPRADSLPDVDNHSGPNT